MDTYGDVAFMANDVRHGFHPSAYHSASGIVAPNVGYDYMPSPDLYSQWSFTPSVQQQQSWHLTSGSGAYTAAFDYPMQFQSPPSAMRQASPPVSPRTSRFTHVPAPTISTVPSMRYKRKQSLDAIDFNEHKKSRQFYNSPSVMSNPSPQSSISSPPAALSTRAHYAVEKRYRSTLNERYATLARIVTQPETMEICRTELPEWEVPMKLEVPEEGAEKHPGKRQSKTTTLSVAIETIELLDRACARKAREFEELSRRLSVIAGSVPMPISQHNG